MKKKKNPQKNATVLPIEKLEKRRHKELGSMPKTQSLGLATANRERVA
jgi:hypothetical protein